LGVQKPLAEKISKYLTKLFLSTVLVVAFALASFASEKKVENQSISFEMSTDLSIASNADVLIILK
jgi:hypothetical protein